MKLICDGLDLCDAVLKVIRACQSKMRGSFTEGIRMKAKNDQLILSATDTEIYIEKIITAETIEEGIVMVNGKIFSEFVRKLDKEQIEIILDENVNNLKIKYQDSVGFLPCLDYLAFPEIKENDINTENEILIKSKDFKELINKTYFSACLDDSRPILKGILLEVKDITITAVAIDGYRLAKCEKFIEGKMQDAKVIVSSKYLVEITRFLSDSEDEVLKIQITRKYLKILVEGTLILARLIEGEFVDYKQLLPKEFTNAVVINKEQLVNALERAKVVIANDNTGIVKFDIKEKFLNIIANSELGNVNENINCNLNGVDILIAFNIRYLIDCLKVVESDFIQINLNTSATPVIIKEIENDYYCYLILPLRINA